MKKPKKAVQFVLCIRKDGCDDLDVRKVYQVIPDADAEKEEYVRIIDESGEDYLYPARYFLAIELPTDAVKAFAEPVGQNA